MEEVDRLAQEVAALRERLSRLSEASLRINESLDLDTVLQGVLDSACSMTSARYGGITTIDESGEVVDFVTFGLSPEQRQWFLDLPAGPALFDYFLGMAGPFRVADLQSHARALGLPEFDTPVPVTSFLAASLRNQGQVVGLIYLTKGDGGQEFTPEDEETLVTFASQSALVIANARRHRDEQRARADLETLVNTAPVGVVMFNARNGQVMSINHECRRIISALHGPEGSAERVLATLTFRRADGREVSLQEYPFPNLLGNGETVRAEEIVLRVPDGRSVTTLLNSTPIRSAGGEVESMVVTLQDMTAMEDLERLRAEFLAMVSHELRAPLTSIKGSAATVMGGTSTFGPAEMMQFFRIIDRQADQMSGLINDLLDVARIEAGTLPVNPEPALVAVLVDQARSAFQSSGTTHPIRIDLPPDLPRVMADPRRIVQVLGNLLSNAARYSPKDSPIRVSATQDDFHVAVSVEDQGSGLATHQMFLVFRKFHRVEEDERGDTGLGLAISKGIVEAHGGRIWAESDGPGHGAKFTFTLPVVEDAAPGAATVPARQATGVRRTERDQVRVLAVDDDPQALRYLHDALTKAGYAPVVTGDPGEALAFMEAGEPHLALLDLVLPGADGVELMQDIRAIANIPVIFLSAYGQEDVVARAFDMGADDYVVKPFSSTELAARIRAVLRKRAAVQESEPSEPYVRGDLVVDYAARSVSIAGHPVRLTATEYRLMAELSTQAGTTVTYDRLSERVWGRINYGDLRPMRSVVRNLRSKLGDDAGDPTYIFTEPRTGYRMARGEPT